MRYILLAVILVSAATLGGCTEGVLDPKGPIAAAERQIMFNSLGIMLAIVIPTILATLGVAYWFRSSNKRARYLPDFEYSGRLEMLVWSIPAMTVLLVGGVAWVGSHDLDPRRPIASTIKPLTVQVVSLDWKWLFIYPDQGVATVNQLTIPIGKPVSFELTSSGVMNSFLRAAARQPDLHHGGNGDAPSAAGRSSWDIPGSIGPVQRQRFLPICGLMSMRSQLKTLRSGWMQLAALVRCSTHKLMPLWPSQAKRLSLSLLVPSLPICSTAS